MNKDEDRYDPDDDAPERDWPFVAAVAVVFLGVATLIMLCGNILLALRDKPAVWPW